MTQSSALSAGRTELFISDLHLSAHEPAVAARFFDFLAGPARSATRLTILGDLFDYWAGDDDLADPFNTRIAAALRALADSGVALAFMPGNRDFLIGNDFASAAGLQLLSDPCLREIGGIPTLLSHGDTLCTDDTAYQAFRNHVRTPAWREAFIARPLADRKREIEGLRARSELEKTIKPMALMDVNVEAVAALLQAHGARTLIHGHTHRQGQHQHGDSTRWVLGDWQAERGNALACAANGWHWLTS